jgi:phosphopantothenoylcysteine decarboxylase/phosphopantothenate--cysteine ligase
MARLLLGISASIAAYKAADLCSRLVKAGHEVTVVMTAGATKLVGPMTFASLTGRPVLTDMWDREEWSKVEHIDLTDRADLIVLAPATADLMARAAHGMGSDMLTTLLLAAASPVLCCPAMNPRMWDNPLVQQNLAKLKSIGWHFLEPGEGTVACGHTGQGRMREPAEIHEAIDGLLPRPRAGKKRK